MRTVKGAARELSKALAVAVLWPVMVLMLAGAIGGTGPYCHGTNCVGLSASHTVCVYNAGNLAAGAAFGEFTVTQASTVDTGSKVAQDVVGVGAGNFVVKVCSDGATCAGGNTFLTYTEACTAAAGTRTAATVQNSGAITAGAVLTVSVTTACATTDPGANVCIHYTSP